MKAPSRVRVDARTLGCACDACPLNKRNPVPNEIHPNPRLRILLESPGRNEEVHGAPVVGASGYYLEDKLKELGLRRSDVNLGNTVLCRPRGRKMKPAEWRKAIECCKPQRDAFLAHSPNVPILACGGWANFALTGRIGVENWMGSPSIGEHGYVVPTWHPANILREPWHTPAFEMDLARALKAEPLRAWPTLIIDDGPAMRDALQHMLTCPDALGVDVETRGANPIDDTLMCIGIGCTHFGVSVPWERYDAGKWGIAEPACEETKALALQVLANVSVKSMHNAQHDRLVLQLRDIPLGGETFDSIVAHSITNPLLPHDLGFVVSYVGINVEPWKADFKVSGDSKGDETWVKRDPRVLRLYNAKDSVASAWLVSPLLVGLQRTPRGMENYRLKMEMSDIALKMRLWGMRVDPEVREAHRIELTAAMAKEAAAFRAAIRDRHHIIRGKDVIHKRNPLTGKKEDTHVRTELYVGPIRLGRVGQHGDLLRLFFNYYGLSPLHRTEGGQPQLDDEMLVHIIGLGVPASEAARHVLAYRRLAKLLGTYVEELPVASTGRVHTAWACWRAVTGRWGSSDPNLQNVPKKMRNMFVPRPGNYFVEADYRALELRIIGLLAADPLFLDWFNRELDVHSRHAEAFYKTATPSKSQRDNAKLVYGFNYGGAKETIWRQLVPKSPDLKLSTVSEVYDAYFATHPWLVQWQKDTIRIATEKGYAEEYLSGRREHFYLGNFEPTKILNTPIQGWAATMMDRATKAVAAELNWEDEAIVAQVHDALVLEGPDPARLREILTRCMTQTYEWKGNKMTFSVDCHVLWNWSPKAEVGEHIVVGARTCR